MNVRRYTSWVETFDISTLRDLWQKGKLSLRPDFQRNEVFKVDWGRGLIKSILERKTNSILHIRTLKNGCYEIIDGSQRISALMKFLDNKFACAASGDGTVDVMYKSNPEDPNEDAQVVRVKAAKYTQMMLDNQSDVIHEVFMSFKFAVVKYSVEMTDDEAAEVFKLVNNGTPLNNQEIANAYLGVISKWVRNAARGTEEKNFTDRLHVVEYFGFNNVRMAIDETIARSVVYEYERQGRDRYASATVQSIKDLYTNALYRYNAERFQPIANGVIRRWNMVRRLIEGSGTTKLYTKNPAQIITLFQFTYAMDSEFGTQAKIDYDVFAPILWSTMNDLSNRVKQGSRPREKTRFQVLLGRYIGGEILEKNAMIMSGLKNFGSPSDYGVTIKDKKRGFSMGDKYDKWVKQKFCCAVTNEPLKFDDAVGGHIIPHSKGGKTVFENLVILSAKINSEMADTPYQDYLERRYLLEN